jgi:assimilatory nitrate reductase catalytic subunit
MRVDGVLRRVSWDAALDRVAGGLRAIIAEHGPDAVALYVSGQLLTEDYYVANKLMKGYVGSANIDTNSRLCMSSAVAGHKRAFGEDLVPGCYEDLELADMVVLVGSNTAWCHPILFQRIARQGRAAGNEAGGDRPAPHRHLRAGRPAPAREAGHGRVAVQRLAELPGAQGAIDDAFVTQHRAFDDALAAAHVDCADPLQVARICRSMRRPCWRSTNCLPPRARSSRRFPWA